MNSSVGSDRVGKRYCCYGQHYCISDGGSEGEADIRCPVRREYARQSRQPTDVNNNNDRRRNDAYAYNRQGNGQNRR